MSGANGGAALAVRTLSGVHIPVPAATAEETVQQLRGKVAPHFGAGANCRLFFNVSMSPVTLWNLLTASFVGKLALVMRVCVRAFSHHPDTDAQLGPECCVLDVVVLPGASLRCCVICVGQGSKLPDKRTLGSLGLQPGQFLVAVQTQKRSAAPPPPQPQPPASAAQPTPATPAIAGAAPVATQQQHGSAPGTANGVEPVTAGGAPAETQRSSGPGVAAWQRGGLQGDGLVRSSSERQRQQSSTPEAELPHTSSAFPATLLPGYTSRPHATPPATPTRQVRKYWRQPTCSILRAAVLDECHHLMLFRAL